MIIMMISIMNWYFLISLSDRRLSLGRDQTLVTKLVLFCQLNIAIHRARKLVSLGNLCKPIVYSSAPQSMQELGMFYLFISEEANGVFFSPILISNVPVFESRPLTVPFFGRQWKASSKSPLKSVFISKSTNLKNMG